MTKHHHVRVKRCILFFFLSFISLAGLQAQPPADLFTERGWQDSLYNLTLLQQNRFSRAADSISDSLLRTVNIGNIALLQTNGRINITIPGCSCGQVTLRTTYSEYVSNDDYLWYGEIVPAGPSDCQQGFMLLRSANNEKFGFAQFGEHYYDVVDVGGLTAIIEQTGVLGASLLEAYGACRTTVDPDHFGSFNSLESRSGVCDVRVLVLYTPNAAAKKSSIQNYARECVDITNQAFKNSQIYPSQMSLNLVAVEQINYDETDIIIDAALDDIKTLSYTQQNAHKADLVVVLGDWEAMASLPWPSGKPSGVADTGDDGNWQHAFVTIDNKSDMLTFAHEVGHLFGARHELSTAEGALNFDDEPGQAHAHTWSHKKSGCIPVLANDCKVKRRTIMFSGGDLKGRMPYYSNPEVTLDGDVTGIVDERNNAAVIRENACTVANNITEEPYHNGHLFVNINGPMQLPCGESEQLNTNVTGAPGPYTYIWYASSDGFEYDPIPGATSSSYTIYGSDYTVDDIVFLKVKVTSTSNSYFGTDYLAIKIIDQTGPEAKLCNRNKVLNKGEKIAVYPNPAWSTLTAEYNVVQGGKVSILIQDTRGTTWFRLDKIETEGPQRSIIPIDVLPQGYYILLLSNGERILTSSFIKQ